MNTYRGKTIKHWKNNAEEDYFTTPISVLKYITVLEEQAKQMEKEQSNDKIQKAIEKFEEAKNKSSSLKDIVYLDGVLAVLDTIKNETSKN